MKAFYVEPNDLGTDWNKPWEKDKEEAQQFVQDASNDYSLQMDKFTNLDILRFNDSALADAIKAWEELNGVATKSTTIRARAVGQSCPCSAVGLQERKSLTHPLACEIQPFHPCPPIRSIARSLRPS
jgi:hypothetical protein